MATKAFRLNQIKSRIYSFTFFRIALMLKLFQVLKQYVRLALFMQREKVILALREEISGQPSQKVLATVVHITSTEEAENREIGKTKIDRLQQTIDGLLMSFAHCDLTIMVITMAGRHIINFLPDYQKHCLVVREKVGCDPMFIGFAAQDELVSRVNQFDWFLFIEDDIVIHDASILVKLKKFNQFSGYKNAVLFPNRYEFYEGVKYYIDFSFLEEGVAVNHWNQFSAVEIDEIKYAECTNPHSGFYCLSQEQMETWIASGRVFQGKSIWAGDRESASTFCLCEVFSLYKPHQRNLHYFEVRHHDTKYSKLHPETSPLKFNPVTHNGSDNF